MEHLLDKKVRYFLNSHHRGREEVRNALKELRIYGRIALVGGMLRDIALFGNAGFNSDLDFVIDTYDREKFDQHMTDIGAKLNRFGGYSVPSRKWRIDIWPLERTWAHVHGHTQVRTLGDIRNATFFTSDAIVYDLTSHEILTQSGYFEALRRKALDINLLPNPNPCGNAVRALRYALLKGFNWETNLSRFMLGILTEFHWKQLCDYEYSSFKTHHLRTLNETDLRLALEAHCQGTEQLLFNPSLFQISKQFDLAEHFR